MRNQLEGTWRLQSWTARHDSGAVSNLGEAVSGLAVIAADGWLSANLMSTEPVRLAPNLAVSYLGYAGPYQIVGDQLVTTVEVSSIPDWVDTQQVRDVELSGDLLVLRTPVVRGVQHKLRWRRVS